MSTGKALTLTTLGLLIAAVGLMLLGGGIYLIILGGSWYFALAGLGLSVAGMLIMRRHALGVLVYLVVLGLSVLWSLWEVGVAFWPLFSRLFMLAVLALPVLLAWPGLQRRTPKAARWPARALAAVIALALGMTLYTAMQPQPIQTAHDAPAPVPGTGVGVMMEGEWRHWAHAVRDPLRAVGSDHAGQCRRAGHRLGLPHR